jgi:hypothetical protein
MNTKPTFDIRTPSLGSQPKIVDFQAELLKSALSPSYPSIFLDTNNYENHVDPDKTPLVIDGKIYNKAHLPLKKIDLDEATKQIHNDLAPPEKSTGEPTIFKADITKNRLYKKRMQRNKTEAALQNVNK